jgi:hypothetical protein
LAKRDIGTIIVRGCAVCADFLRSDRMFVKNVLLLQPKIDVEGFGLLATTKKMLNQQHSAYNSQSSIRLIV